MTRFSLGKENCWICFFSIPYSVGGRRIFLSWISNSIILCLHHCLLTNENISHRVVQWRCLSNSRVCTLWCISCQKRSDKSTTFFYRQIRISSKTHLAFRKTVIVSPTSLILFIRMCNFFVLSLGCLLRASMCLFVFVRTCVCICIWVYLWEWYVCVFSLSLKTFIPSALKRVPGKGSASNNVKPLASAKSTIFQLS